ncbi:argininosuccinate synthase, chloroplastic-like [Vicia villosa]|uniref:argininosuccinate synthase, chloroplastic-like n=1 Tax=Vicia villosa TaxID=3911 RepID=UPI00273C8CA1|nr:argininosuccinate synthase, chloroplastic-like [Vicia villosa]
MAHLKALPSNPCATTTTAPEHILFNQFEKANSCSFKELKPITNVSAYRLQVVNAASHIDTTVEVSEAKRGSGLRGKLNQVVLAYSGGLDTSVIVPWLRENYGCDVACFTADVGQIVKIRLREFGLLKSGLPISLNGKTLSPASLLTELNEIGGRHGIGRIDMVENRLVGMKSRGVYEIPGGTILFAAAREMEFLTLDRETIQVKDSLALKYAELIYAGRWFDPLRESMDAFMQKITETTTGSVTLKLYKGSVTVTGRKSPFSLYRKDILSFESSEIYDQADAAGFIRLYGLPMRVWAMLEQDV